MQKINGRQWITKEKSTGDIDSKRWVTQIYKHVQFWTTPARTQNLETLFEYKKWTGKNLFRKNKQITLCLLEESFIFISYVTKEETGTFVIKSPLKFQWYNEYLSPAPIIFKEN